MRQTLAALVGVLLVVSGAFIGEYGQKQLTKRTDKDTIVALVAVLNCGKYKGSFSVTRDGQYHEQSKLPLPELSALANSLPPGTAQTVRLYDNCQGAGT
jgi:hypothetical protein